MERLVRCGAGRYPVKRTPEVETRSLAPLAPPRRCAIASSQRHQPGAKLPIREQPWRQDAALRAHGTLIQEPQVHGPPKQDQVQRRLALLHARVAGARQVGVDLTGLFATVAIAASRAQVPVESDDHDASEPNQPRAAWGRKQGRPGAPSGANAP